MLSHYTHTYHAGRARWDKELGRNLTNKEWEGACYRARHTTCNMQLTDTLTKLVLHPNTAAYHGPNTESYMLEGLWTGGRSDTHYGAAPTFNHIGRKYLMT